MASQVELSRYSLASIRKALSEAEEETVSEGTTITVSFSSPKGFEHNYTFPNEVETVDKLNDIVNKTIEKAEERLKNGWLRGRDIDPEGKIPQEAKDTWRNTWQEIQSTLDIERPVEVDEFLDKKEAEPNLEVAERLTSQIYSRVERARSISIQQRLNQSTEEIGELSEEQAKEPEQVSLDDIDFESGNTEYYSNLKKVEQNLEFEENIDNGDVFLEDRTRTTGDLTWYNRDGESRHFLIFGPAAVLQDERGGQQLRRFDDKEEAWNYYKENRLG